MRLRWRRARRTRTIAQEEAEQVARDQLGAIIGRKRRYVPSSIGSNVGPLIPVVSIESPMAVRP